MDSIKNSLAFGTIGMSSKTKILWPLVLAVCIFNTFLCLGITLPALSVQKKKIVSPKRALAGQLIEKITVVTPLPTRTNYLVWDSGNTNVLPVGIDYGFRVYSTTNPTGPWGLYSTVYSHTNHVVFQIDNTNKVEFFRVATIIQ